jgi:hypothetical protein
MRVGKDELQLMSAGEVWWDSDGLPAKKNREPEHDVKKEGGKDERTDIDAPFGSPDGQCSAYVTSKHGGLLGGKSLTSGISRPVRRSGSGGVGCMPWLADIKAVLQF